VERPDDMLSDPPGLWTRCLDRARTTMPQSTFTTWLSKSFFESLEEDSFIVRFPNQFMANFVMTNHGEMLQGSLRELSGHPGLSLLCVGDPAPPFAPSMPAQPPPAPVRQVHSPSIRSNYLHPSYTFDRFVAGPSNELAHAGARAVAMNPGSPSYNPLFIYGGVGLGKTHLIQGIAHEVKRIHPDKRFVYVSSEQFLHLFVTSLGRQNVDEFRRIYRDIDLLLMDDVQFLGGKTQTQEELFHRFNDLYQTGRQIVFTSDRLPGEITGLEERLVSRFQSGLVADIQPPDYETRMAILELKVRDEGEFFPSEVLDFIASTIRSNVRQLEGAVHRLAASSRINGAPIDLTLTKRVLTDAFGSSAQRLSAGSITAAVAEAFAVSPSQLRGKQRRRDILIPRQVAMFLIREMTESSLVEIGRFFSGRDHSTVLNSIDRIRQLSSEDPSLRRRILDLRTRLSG